MCNPRTRKTEVGRAQALNQVMLYMRTLSKKQPKAGPACLPTLNQLFPHGNSSYIVSTVKAGMVTLTCSVHTQGLERKRLRQEDCKVKASLDYIAKPYLKTTDLGLLR